MGISYIKKDIKTTLGVQPSDPASAAIMGAVGTENHPYRVEPDPDYTFQEDPLRLLMTVWGCQHRTGGRERDGMSLYFAGPKGSGKSSHVEEFFARLGVPVVRVTGSKRTQLVDFIIQRELIDGNLNITDGPLITAMRQGLPFLVDEIDLIDPGELTGLNGIIERRELLVPETGELVKAATGFFIAATGNSCGQGDTKGDYAGVRVMNAAFMSRALKGFVGYADEETEVRMLRARFSGWDEAAIRKVVRMANAIRDAYEGGTPGLSLSSTMSHRELVRWCDLTSLWLMPLLRQGRDGRLEALKVVYLNGLANPAEREAVIQLYQTLVADKATAQATDEEAA